MDNRAITLVILSACLLASCAQPKATSTQHDIRASLPAVAPIKKLDPRFFRYKVGEATVTAISDGASEGKLEAFQNITPQEAKTLLKAAGQPNPPMFAMQGFLVDIGNQRVLVDTGTGIGSEAGTKTGHLLANLGAAGVKPESIQHIVISHMHWDHIGGLLDEKGKARFPKARLHLGAADLAYWGDKANAAKASAEEKTSFTTAQAVAQAYKGKIKTISKPTEIVPGLSGEPANGHTPGHTIYRLQSKNRELVFLGDMVHSTAIQFPRPAVTVSFDANQAMARATRLRYLKQLFSQPKEDGGGKLPLVAASHFPYPGIGQVKASGSGYRYSTVSAPIAGCH